MRTTAPFPDYPKQQAIVQEESTSSSKAQGSEQELTVPLDSAPNDYSGLQRAFVGFYSRKLSHAQQASERFIEALFNEEAAPENIDFAMGQLQSALRLGDSGLAGRLLSAALDGSKSPGIRSHCLETLSASRAADLGEVVRILILKFLESKDAVLQYSAIAAATDLPEIQRRRLREHISPLIGSRDPIGRAAVAFLGY